MSADTVEQESKVAYRRKNNPLAVLAMLAMILFSIFSISSTDKAHVDIDSNKEASQFEWTIRDNAEILSKNVQNTILSYNSIWDRRYNSVITVVTESTTCSEETLEELSWYYADSMGLGEGDAILMISTGGEKSWYFNYGDDFSTIMTLDAVDALTETISFWVGENDPDHMLTGFYDQMSEIYISNFGLGNDEPYEENPYLDNLDVTETFASLIYVIIMIMAVVLIILAISETLRFKTYRTKYYGVPTPPPYQPVFFWHRPGSSWYRHNWRPVPPPHPPRPPRYSDQPRTGPFGGGYSSTPKRISSFGGVRAGKKPPRGGGTFGGMTTGSTRKGGFGGSFSRGSRSSSSGSSSRGSSFGGSHRFSGSSSRSSSSRHRPSGGSRGGSFGGSRRK